MSRTLKITPLESVTIRTSTPELLEVEATFEPRHRPPKHWHPNQDERVEILEGTMRWRVGDRDLEVGVGDVIDVPRGTVHQFWNSDTERARVLWQWRPGGRTEQWFIDIDAVHCAGRVGRNGMPGPLALAVFLTEYRDVFRLATPAAPLVNACLAALAPIGRLRGYRPATAVE